MSLVDLAPVEVLLTEAEAVEVTARLRAIAVAIEDMPALVVKAYYGQAWRFDYANWDLYCAAEIDTANVRLPRDVRRGLVADLRDNDMSQRAIASALGISRGSVQNDLGLGGQKCPPEVEPKSVCGDCGREAEKCLCEKCDRTARFGGGGEDDNKDNDVDVTDKPATESRKITGLDGKRYHDKTRAAVNARVAKAKELAARGCTSRQIAHDIGLRINSFSTFKKRHNVVVPADAVTGRIHRLDANRIVGETVATLDGIVTGLRLFDDLAVADLDPALIEDWVTSLDCSLPALKRFHKQIKEMTQ